MSDVEWEESIQADFGTRGQGMLCEIPNQMDVGLDMDGLVRNAFHEYDEQVGAVETEFDTFHDARNDNDTVPDFEDEEVDDDLHSNEDNLHPDVELFGDSTSTPLFAGARLTWLTATLLILNLCKTHG